MTTPDAQVAAVRRALPPGAGEASRALACLLGDALAWAANRGRLRDLQRQLDAIRRALPYGDACHHCRGGAGALPCPHCGTSGSVPDLSIAVEGQLAYLAKRAADAEEEVARYRVSLVAHHNIAALSDEAIRESRGGPCQICEKAQREAAGRSVAVAVDEHGYAECHACQRIAPPDLLASFGCSRPPGCVLDEPGPEARPC